VKTDDLIIKTLRENPSKPVSGELMAHRIGISRAAVWKRISRLRELGFNIEGGASKGYILCGIEDLIRPELIGKKLETRFVGKTIIYRSVTGSTNLDALDLAAKGASEGTCVISDAQTAGRGRLGRSWVAPAGGSILTSVILRPKLSPQTATLLTLAAGVAAARAIHHVTDLKPWIKWPNDLFVGNRKLAGILTEMHAEMDRVHFVVVGIGMNVNMDRKSFPSEIRKIATSLSIEARRTVSRNQLIATLYHELEAAYVRLVEHGAKPIIAQWEELAKIRGKHIRASLVNDRKVYGTAIGLDSDGALLIEDRNGKIRKITAGDVEVTNEPPEKE